MTKRTVEGILAVVIASWAVPALAQEKHAEITVLAGWALSEGVSGDPVIAGNLNVYDRVDPKSAFKWGLSGGVLVTHEAEVGFRFGRQLSTLKASGPRGASTNVGNMTVDTYHGYFAFNFLDDADAVRPYVMGGVGATHFSAVDFTRLNGQTGTIGGVTRFS